MKTAALFTTLFLILSMFITSCDKNEDQLGQMDQGHSINLKAPTPHIYHATWSEWGRESKDCNGWGLCEFQDCWFCCTDENDNIVDCEFGTVYDNAGWIIINDETNEGSFIIKLNPLVEIQNQAIINKLPLYVDKDIESDSFHLFKGEYPFEESIGNYGGYKMRVNKK